MRLKLDTHKKSENLETRKDGKISSKSGLKAQTKLILTQANNNESSNSRLQYLELEVLTVAVDVFGCICVVAAGCRRAAIEIRANLSDAVIVRCDDQIIH